MRILYITEKLKAKSGGTAVSQRNFDVIKSLYPSAEICKYYVTRSQHNALISVYNEIVYENIYGFNGKAIRDLLNYIACNKIDNVFVENSNNGFLAKHIKRNFPSIHIVTFFHNVERLFMEDQLRLTKHPKFLYRVLVSKKCEDYACRFSDKIICLNQRDAEIISQLYNRKPDIIAPVSLPDDFDSSLVIDAQVDKNNLNGLFIGSFFPPNVCGIRKFITEVLPKVNIHLTIAGSGMDALKDEFSSLKNVTVLGFVENLQKLYAEADFMVMPINDGSGMKVKTAEALKYGKYLLASSESLVGYNTTSNEAIECKTSEEFVRAIKGYDRKNKFNQSSRDLFLRDYSYGATMSLYERLFEEL